MSTRKTDQPPRFCDFDCPHADFPPPETAGICRTMAAVWCSKLRELVDKNTPCSWELTDGGGLKARREPRNRRPGPTRRSSG